MSKACSYQLLLGVNLLAVAVSLAILGITLNIMYGSGIGVSALEGLPVQIYYASIAFSGLVFLISFLGILGGYFHHKSALYLFTLLDFLSGVFTLIVLILALLYANGISTIPQIDGSVTTIDNSLESELLKQAVNQSSVWLTTQKELSCCGVDIAATYDYATYDLSDSAFQLVLESGPNCAAGRTEIAAVHALYPTYNSSVDTYVASDANLKNYFCKQVAESFIKLNTIYIGAIAGALVVLQFITLIAAFKLLCSVTLQQGGFVIPPDPSGGALAYGQPQTGNYGAQLA